MLSFAMKNDDIISIQRAISVHPHIPISISVNINGNGDMSIGHPSHNNGGYRNVITPLASLLETLESNGIKMTPLKTAYGELYVNLHPIIPLSIREEKGHEKGKPSTRLCYPTHNNGGYIIERCYTFVENVVNNSFSWYSNRS